MTADREWDALADEPIDDQDLRTLSGLRAILQASDPVPSGLAERAKFAMSVAALEAEIAEITTTTAELAGVRSTDYDRAGTITFSSEQLSAMITIELVDGNEAGRFTFTSVQRGLVHLVMRRLDDPQSRPVITPAIEI